MNDRSSVELGNLMTGNITPEGVTSQQISNEYPPSERLPDFPKPTENSEPEENPLVRWFKKLIPQRQH